MQSILKEVIEPVMETENVKSPKIKLVTSILSADTLDTVAHALGRFGEYGGVTATDAQVYRTGQSRTAQYRGITYRIPSVRMVRIEIMAAEACVDEIVASIRRLASAAAPVWVADIAAPAQAY